MTRGTAAADRLVLMYFTDDESPAVFSEQEAPHEATHITLPSLICKCMSSFLKQELNSVSIIPVKAILPTFIL